MSSKSIELADAIVSQLNQHPEGFILQFEAERKALPLTTQELETLSTLKVMVFTGSQKAERRTQRGFKKTYKPIVVLQRKLDGATEEVNLGLADQLVELSDQISERLEAEELVNLHFIGFDEGQDRDEYNAELMHAHGVFSVVRTFEYAN